MNGLRLKVRRDEETERKERLGDRQETRAAGNSFYLSFFSFLFLFFFLGWKIVGIGM